MGTMAMEYSGKAMVKIGYPYFSLFYLITLIIEGAVFKFSGIPRYICNSNFYHLVNFTTC